MDSSHQLKPYGSWKDIARTPSRIHVTKKQPFVPSSMAGVVDFELALKLSSLIVYFLIAAASLVRVRVCYYSCEDVHILLGTIAQALVTITIPISLYHVWDHLSNFLDPRLQKQVVRIIWLVPMFSLESFLSITFVQQAVYFQSIREIYEAFSIHCFMRFLLHIMGDTDEVVGKLAAFPSSMGEHRVPFCWLPPWQMGSEFVTKCKMGVFQYVVVRFINCNVTMLLFALGLYQEGKYAANRPFIWITIINFVSQTWALYSLVLFFLCAHKELHAMKPFLKFLCMKVIFFLSFWQSLVIGVLVRLGRIHAEFGHSAQDVAIFARALLVSVEMLIASVAFSYAFPVSDFTGQRFSSNSSGSSEHRSVGLLSQLHKHRQVKNAAGTDACCGECGVVDLSCKRGVFEFCRKWLSVMYPSEGTCSSCCGGSDAAGSSSSGSCGSSVNVSVCNSISGSVCSTVMDRICCPLNQICSFLRRCGVSILGGVGDEKKQYSSLLPHSFTSASCSYSRQEQAIAAEQGGAWWQILAKPASRKDDVASNEDRTASSSVGVAMNNNVVHGSLVEQLRSWFTHTNANHKIQQMIAKQASTTAGGRPESEACDHHLGKVNKTKKSGSSHSFLSDRSDSSVDEGRKAHTRESKQKNIYGYGSEFFTTKSSSFHQHDQHHTYPQQQQQHVLRQAEKIKFPSLPLSHHQQHQQHHHQSERHDSNNSYHSPASTSKLLVSPRSAFSVCPPRQMLSTQSKHDALLPNSAGRASTLQRRGFGGSATPNAGDGQGHGLEANAHLTTPPPLRSSHKVKCDTPQSPHPHGTGFQEKPDRFSPPHTRSCAIDDGIEAEHVYVRGDTFDRIVQPSDCVSPPRSSPVVQLLSHTEQEHHEEEVRSQQQQQQHVQRQKQSIEGEYQVQGKQLGLLRRQQEAAASAPWASALWLSGPPGAVGDLSEDLGELESQLRGLYSRSISAPLLPPQLKRLVYKNKGRTDN